jgi:hypothetical protein
MGDYVSQITGEIEKKAYQYPNFCKSNSKGFRDHNRRVV